MKAVTALVLVLTVSTTFAQDLSEGNIANDLAPHPMEVLTKPAYLASAFDPSFTNTKIIRISNAAEGRAITPMYNTIQAWSADETYMILYAQGIGHQLLNGNNYTFIRNLTDISPDDVETIYWHFTDPEILFYLELGTADFIRYNVATKVKTTVVNLSEITNCSSDVSLGNDIQMMSWDSDVVGFRCGNSGAYSYRISTNELTQFNISDVEDTAPMPFPSGNLFFHNGSVYDANGNHLRTFNLDAIEHSCLGKLSNGDDAYFVISFEEGPQGGCQGTLVAHNAVTGHCFPVTSYADYGYPQSGTHISALAHKNTEGGWVAVSMMGFDLNGQDLLDQELFIAQVNETDANVYRVAHHRSDEEEFDYWGEPHVTISPSGTRLLFGSDWSGVEDGISVDSYVAELQAHVIVDVNELDIKQISIYPNPVKDFVYVHGELNVVSCEFYSLDGKLKLESKNESRTIDVRSLSNGVYTLIIRSKHGFYPQKILVQRGK